MPASDARRLCRITVQVTLYDDGTYSEPYRVRTYDGQDIAAHAVTLRRCLREVARLDGLETELEKQRKETPNT